LAVSFIGGEIQKTGVHRENHRPAASHCKSNYHTTTTMMDITEILLKVALNTITQIRWLDRLVKIVYEISCMIFSFRFYLDVMVSEINRVNGSKKGPVTVNPTTIRPRP
jgi:hypothetical protein